MKKSLFICLLIILFLASCNDSEKPGIKLHSILEHEYETVEVVKEATCTEEGIRKLICACGAYIEEKTPIKAHSLEWTTDVEATCTESGLSKGVCSVCGYEEQKSIAALGHEYTWSIAEEATCTTDGVYLGKCSCGDTVSKTLEATGHVFDESTTVKIAATTSKEGSVSNICLNCSEEQFLKIMKVPSVTRNMGMLTWEKISGADGYNVYIDDKLYADVGDVSKFNVPLDIDATYLIYVEAYSNNSDYCSKSDKSNVVVVTVKHDPTNLQAGLGTDFEGFNSNNHTLKNEFLEFYGNFGDGVVEIIKENGQTFAKLLPTTNSLKSTITHEANPEILKAGTYVISMDVKLGSDNKGTLSFGIFNGENWIPEYTQIDIANANKDQWTKVSCEYVLEANQSGYANLDIAYVTTELATNNFILIDNISISLKGEEANFESERNYNFDENFTRLLNKSGWKSDGTNNVIYNEEDSIENSVVTVDGNSVFKAYTSKGKCTSVNFKGNKNIATAGVYELTIKVKGGPDANRLGSIGIRLFGKSFKVVDVRFSGVENITSTEWTTLKLTFTVKETKITDYVNIDFYVYTNNDENSSVDNYLLVDDISVYKINIQ